MLCEKRQRLLASVQLCGIFNIYWMLAGGGSVGS